MHRPLRLTIDRSAHPVQLALACRSRGRRRRERRSRPTAMALARARPREALIEAGCRDFFVSTWAEAEALGILPDGVEPGRAPRRRTGRCRRRARVHARPCLNSVEQVARWKEIAPGRACDVMIDTGHEPARPAPDRDRRARRADDRHAAQPSRLRRRGQRDQRRCSSSAFARSRRRCRRERYSFAN